MFYLKDISDANLAFGFISVLFVDFISLVSFKFYVEWIFVSVVTIDDVFVFFFIEFLPVLLMFIKVKPLFIGTFLKVYEQKDWPIFVLLRIAFSKLIIRSLLNYKKMISNGTNASVVILTLKYRRIKNSRFWYRKLINFLNKYIIIFYHFGTSN